MMRLRGLLPVQDAASQHQPTESEDDESALGSIPSDLLDRLPQGVRRQILASYTRVSGPTQSPLLEKITSEHLSLIIKNSENERVRSHDASKRRSLLQALYVLVGVCLA